MELYHALNRGVDKRTIFLDSQDHARFVHDLYMFNTTETIDHTLRSHQKHHMADLRSRPYVINERGGKPIVQIHGWCLMGNHYHLLLSEVEIGGMILFLRRLNVGYAKYFNERYARTGTLFQGRTKKILIDSDKHLLHILNYIHLNPLDTNNETNSWRQGKILDAKKALERLYSYKWSSFLDYAKVKNFPSVLTTSFFEQVFNENYTNQLEKYVTDISLTDIQAYILE